MIYNERSNDEIIFKNDINFKEKYNADLNNYYINLLKKVKNIIILINEESVKLNELIKNILSKYKNIDINTEIDKCIKKLEEYNKYQNNYENLLNNQKRKFKEFFELTSNIYINNYFDKIKELNDELKNNVYSIADYEFMPPLINELCSSSVNFSSGNIFFSQENITEEKEKENENEKNNKLCTFCRQSDSICICDSCLQEFCSDCLNSIKYSEEIFKEHYCKHNIIYIDQIDKEYDRSKILFLKSVIFIIQNILKKANFFLKSETILLENKTLNNKSYVSKAYIKRKFIFPYIENFSNFDLKPQIEFLEESNKFLESELNFNVNDFTHSFQISEMNKTLLSAIQNIFNDEKINSFKEALKIIEDNFYSYTEDLTKEKLILDEKNISDNTKESEFDLNKFNYSINLIPNRPKTDYIFNDFTKIKNNLINGFVFQFSIEKENITVSFDHKIFFIDNYIRTKEFFDLPLKKIKTYYQNLVELQELKMLNDVLCNQYEMIKFLDYRGNFIIPNKSLNFKRGTEKYDPPYGWIGIGLKVIDEYENNDWLNNKTESSEWATAYHGVGRLSSHDEIIQILKNVIVNKEGLTNGPSQIKCHFKDIRHPGKKIGTGVYLTQSINIAEEYSGIIQINNKKYNIVLMAKVLIKKIRQPEDFNYWILNGKDIRVYRLLLKEKK